MLKISLYHGYELTGSGSNEYTRYLSRTLAQLGHEAIPASAKRGSLRAAACPYQVGCN